MRDYHSQRRQREPVVKSLYGLGLTIEEIAQFTGWNHATVAQDVRRLGGAKSFPDRPDKAHVFEVAFRRYAHLAITQDPNKYAEMKALGEWLPSKEVMIYLEGVARTILDLLTPAYPPEKTSIAKLMRHVFGLYNQNFNGPREIWGEFLKGVASGQIPAPQNLDYLKQALAGFALIETRPNIMPIWDDEAFTLVESQIECLSEPEKKIVRQYHGIDCEYKTMVQIGEPLGMSRNWVSHIYGRAKAQLRMRLRNITLGKPVGNALQRELEHRRREKREAERAQMPYDQHLVELLQRKMEELDLTVRAANCLQHAGIEYIGQLVQRTEEGLLRTKYFGRKSLKEMKEILASMGFSLGMTDQNPAVAKFNEFLKNSP